MLESTSPYRRGMHRSVAQVKGTEEKFEGTVNEVGCQAESGEPQKPANQVDHGQGEPHGADEGRDVISFVGRFSGRGVWLGLRKEAQ